MTKFLIVIFFLLLLWCCEKSLCSEIITLSSSMQKNLPNNLYFSNHVNTLSIRGGGGGGGGGEQGRSVWSSSSSLNANRKNNGIHGSSSASHHTQQYNKSNYFNINSNNNNNDSNQRQVEELYSSSATRSGVETKDAMNAFLSRDSRRTFITRVYAILSAQLTFTSIVTIAMNLNREKVLYYLLNSGKMGRLVPLLSMALSTVAWFTIALSDRARHEAPLKWQLLSLFTIGESIMVGLIGCFYSFKTLILAMGCTGVATSAITAYTMLQKNPKYDLSQWGAGLFSAGLIFLLVGLIQIFFPGALQMNQMIYSAMGATLFSFYLAYHTRLIVGGKHAKYRMNEDDYVFAAMARKLHFILYTTISHCLGNS